MKLLYILLFLTWIPFELLNIMFSLTYDGEPSKIIKFLINKLIS